MNRPETPFRQWRKQLGLSQTAAAEKLGYGERRVRAFDRGEQIPPYIVELGMAAVSAGVQAGDWRKAA